MKYSNTAITQLTRWYKQILIKCALFNAALFTFGAVVATPANALTTEVYLGPGYVEDGVDLKDLYPDGEISGQDIGVYGASAQTNSFTAQDIDISGTAYGTLLYNGLTFNVGDADTTSINIDGGTGDGTGAYYGSQISLKADEISVSGDWAVSAYEYNDARNPVEKGANISITGDEINIDATSYGVIALNQTGSQYAPSIDINATTVNIESTGAAAVHAGNGTVDTTNPVSTVNITADNITLTAENGNGIGAMSQGIVNIEGNTTINAENAILTRGNAQTYINTSGDNTVVMNGDIVFDYDKATSGTSVDAVVDITLNGESSSWTGNTVVAYDTKPETEKLAVNNATITLQDGATWNATKITDSTGATDGRYYTALNNLNVDTGTVNIADSERGIEVENLVASDLTVGGDGKLNVTKSVDTTDGVIDDYSAKVVLGNNVTIKGDLDFINGTADQYAAAEGDTVKYTVANLLGGIGKGTKEVQVVSNGATVDVSEAKFTSENGMEFLSSGSADGKMLVKGMTGGIEEAADESDKVAYIEYQQTEDETLDSDVTINNNFVFDGGDNDLNVNAQLGVADGAQLSISNANLKGTGSLYTAKGATTYVKDSQVYVDVDIYGEYYSDPTTYYGTVNVSSTANFEGDTFTAGSTLSNNGVANLSEDSLGNKMTFDSTAAITGAGVTNLVYGETVFNNTASSNTINVAKGAKFSGTLASTGVLNTQNDVIDTGLGTVTGGDLYIDASLKGAGSTDTFADATGATVKKINITSTEYGTADSLTLDMNGATVDPTNVEISGAMNYYTKATVDGSGNLVLSDKLVNTSTIQGTGDTTTPAGDVVLGSVADTTTIGTTDVNIALDNTAKTIDIASGTATKGAMVGVESGTTNAVDISAVDSTANKSAEIDVNATTGKIKLEANDTGASKTAKVEVNGTTGTVTATAAGGLIVSDGTNNATLTAKTTGLDVAQGLTVGGTAYGITATGAGSLASLKVGGENVLTEANVAPAYSGTTMADVASYVSTNGAKIATVADTSGVINTVFDAKQTWLSGELGYDTKSTDAKTILTAAGFTNQTTGDTDVGLIDAALQLKADKQDKLVIAADSGLKWNDANQTQLAVKLEANKGLKVSDNGLAIDAGDTMQFSTSGKLDVKYDTNTFTATTTDGLKIASKGIKAGMIDDGAVGFANLATDAVATSITGATNKVATDAAVKAYAEKVVSDAITFNTDNTVTLTVGSNSANVYDTTGTANYVKANAQSADYTALTSGAVDLTTNTSIAGALQTLDAKKASLEKDNTFTGANTFKSDSGIVLQNATTPSVSSNLVATQLTIGTDTHDVLQVTVSDTSGDGSALYVKDADIATNGGFIALDSTGMDRFTADEDGIELKNASGDTTFFADTATGNLQTAGTLSVAGGNFTVDGNGAVAAAGGRFTIDKDGKTIVGNDFAVTDKFTVSGATGNTQIGGDLGVTNKFKVEGATGNTYVVGTFSAADGNFTVDASGNTAVAGTMDIEGDTTIGDKFSVTAADGSFSAAGGKFAVNENGSIAAADNKFVVNKDGNITKAGTISAADGTFLVKEGGEVSAAAGTFLVKEGGIVTAAAGKFQIKEGGLVSAASGNFLIKEDGAFSASNGNFTVDKDGNVTAQGDLGVQGTSWLKNTNVDGALAVTGTSWLKNTNVDGALAVSGDSTVGQNFAVAGTSYLHDTFVTGDMAVSGTTKTGALTFDGTSYVAAMDQGAAAITGGVVDDQAKRTMATNATVAKTVGNLASLATAANGVTSANDVADAINSLGLNVETATGGTFAADGVWTGTVTGTKAVDYAQNVAYNDLVSAVDQVSSNIGAETTATYGNITSANTVNANLDQLDASIGDRSFNDTHYVAPNSDLASATRVLDSNLYRIDNEVKDLRKDVNRGFASMAALSALVPNARANGNTQVSVGTGMYSGHTGFALGGFHWFNDNLLMNVGVAYGDGDKSDVIYRAGVTYSW